MKKISLIMVIILVFSLVGCKGSNNITLRIPVDYFDEDLIDSDDLQDGIESISREDDEVIVVMGESNYRNLLEELKLALEEELDGLLEDEDCTYIKDIEYIDDFSEVKVFVDVKEYEESLDWTPMLISILSETYQIYGGLEVGVYIEYIDEQTDEVLNIVDYPEV